MTLHVNDWKVLPLSEVLQKLDNGRQLQQGWSPRCLAYPASDADTWAVVKTTAIQPGWFDETQNKELPVGMTPKPGIEILAGDLLMTCAGPRSRCGVPTLVRRTRSKLMMSGKMYRFRPLPFVDPRYLEMWLLSPEAQTRIDKMKTGISDSGLNLTQDRFLGLTVPVPPIEEQRRIVGLLEDHLSRLEAADAGLCDALARSETLLTAGLWNLTHGREGGKRVRLDEIAEVRLGRQRSPKNHTGDRMRPYLRAANVGWDELRLEDVKTMQFTEAEERIYHLEAGDILLTEASGSPGEVGKSAVYLGVPADVCFQNTLIRVRCHGADPNFVQKYLLAEARAGRFMPESRGVGINHLGRARLAALPVELPSQALQASVVAEAHTLVETVERLKRATIAQQRRSVTLRRAALAAAFSGNFTRQHTNRISAQELVYA